MPVRIAASPGRQCLTKAGPLAHVSSFTAVSIFLALLSLCFCISIYLLMLVKGVPDLEATSTRTPRDKNQHVDSRHDQQQRRPRVLSNDPTHYTPMPGTRFAKACKGCLCLGSIVSLHILMYLCVRHMTYCSPRSSRVYFTRPNLFTALELASLWWHTMSVACCANLVIEARVCGEDCSKRIVMDVAAAPVLILSFVFFVLTAPIHWMRRVVIAV